MMAEVLIASFYRFTPIDDPAHRQHGLAKALCGAGVKGSVLIADEGINGTLAGQPDAMAQALAALTALPGCAGLAPRFSTAAGMPFARLKVRLKREIVTLGVDGVDPAARVGTYVAPADWNALVDDKQTVVIDVRNGFEVKIGSFDGAIDPGTDSFRDFPAWFEARHARAPAQRYALFCTGGIRCEKATSWLIGCGFGEVYHLDGGILGYLAAVPQGQSRWRGACFVFDDRVALTHGLAPGGHVTCRACGDPVPAGAPAEAACRCAGGA